MASVSITKLYDLLNLRIGRESAESLTSYVEEKIKDELNDKSQMLATKEDIWLTKEDIRLTKEDIRLTKVEMGAAIANAKTEMIKWMFIFWIGQVGATFGFILLFLKK